MQYMYVQKKKNEKKIHTTTINNKQINIYTEQLLVQKYNFFLIYSFWFINIKWHSFV